MLVLVATVATLLASCVNDGASLGKSGAKFTEIYDSKKVASGYYDVTSHDTVKLGSAEILDTAGKLVLYRASDSVKLYNIDDNNVCLTLPYHESDEYELYDEEYLVVWNTEDAEGVVYNSDGEKLSDLEEGYADNYYEEGALVAGDSVYVLREGELVNTYNIKPEGNNFINPSLYTFGEHYAHRITGDAVRFFDSDMREVSALLIPGGVSDVACYQFGNGKALIYYRESADGDDYSYSLDSKRWCITQGIFDVKSGKLDKVEDDVMLAYVFENRAYADFSEIGMRDSCEYLLLYLPIYNKKLVVDEDEMGACIIDANGKIGYELGSFIPGQMGIPVSFAGANCYAVQTDLACKILSLDGEEIASFDGTDLVLKKSFGYVMQGSEGKSSLSLLDKDGDVEHSYTSATVLVNDYHAVIYSVGTNYYRYIGSDEPTAIRDYLALGVYVGEDGRLYDLMGNDLLGEEISDWSITASTKTTLLIRVKYKALNAGQLYGYVRITIDGGKS